MSEHYGIGPAYRALTMKCVEPVKRNKDGVKWIIHRFPIKGGISIRDAMIYDMLIQRNSLLHMIKVI